MSNEFSVDRTHAFPLPSSSALTPYVAELAEMVHAGTSGRGLHEESLLLPTDSGVLIAAEIMKERYAHAELKYVVVVGIGGSNLGTKAVYDALYGNEDLGRARMPKLLFFDTASVSTLRVFDEILLSATNAQEILINLISKSGNTAESIANFEVLYQVLEKRFSDIASRVVCTTDVDSALWLLGKSRGFGLLPIPAHVGGRFSVFSPVGIFPLLLAGVPVAEFREGGAEMLRTVTLLDQENNPAIKAATELFVAMHEGCAMLNIFHFNPELESLGKWERQLIAESLGKEKDLDGKVVHTGITPIVSIGSTDLHSMAQLYFGGPRDKFTMLIRATENTEVRVSAEGMLAPLVGGIGGKSEAEIMEAILAGVEGAYTKNALPFISVRLPSVSARTLGLYMEWRMATVMYTAKLMHVNPFDQPNVEDYKVVTKALLNKS
jgi:glucose-6-phosphate isomerase